jgi:hypothetical protein
MITGLIVGFIAGGVTVALWLRNSASGRAMMEKWLAKAGTLVDKVQGK